MSLPSAFWAPDSFRSAGPRWNEGLVLNRASRLISIFSPCVQPPLPLLSSPLQHPSTHVFDSSAVTKSFTLYLVCCVGEVGASSWGRRAGVCGWGVRLRESFLLFMWGVPPGGALGMTFVESLTPAHTHAHTHHTHARTFHPCLFFPPIDCWIPVTHMRSSYRGPPVCSHLDQYTPPPPSHPP